MNADRQRLNGALWNGIWASYNGLVQTEFLKTFEVDGMRGIRSAYPGPLFNQVLHFNHDMDQLSALMREPHNSAGLRLNVVPMNPLSADEQNEIARLGFSQTAAVPILYSGPDNTALLPVGPDLRFEIVESPQHRRDFQRVLGEGFEIPDVRIVEILCHALFGPAATNVLGYLDDEAITCGTLMVFGELAYLHKGAVLPNHRRKGYGTDCFHFRMNLAMKLGIEHLGIMAGAKGSQAYSAHSGFEEMFTVAEFDAG